MSPKPGWRRILATGVAVHALAASLPAQNLLCVEHDGQPRVVVAAAESFPRVKLDGKVVTVYATRFALKPVDEYLPCFVAVRDLDVKTTYALMQSAEVNNDLRFSAKFETGYELDDVFLVLDLDTMRQGRLIFLYEVGRLAPNKARNFHVTVPLADPLGRGNFRFHLFAGGAEVLHSGIPTDIREKSLDRMIARRIAGKPDGDPKPYVGPIPEYPASLRNANLKGEALVAFRVGTNGSVRDPVVKSATDPAFGESALAAARLWRFLPAVKGGRPVEADVEMPFAFAAPRS